MNVVSYQYFPEYQLFNSLDQLSINKSELWAREENFWLQEEDCHHTWHTCWKTKQPGRLRNVSDLQSCVHQVQGQNSGRNLCSHPSLPCLLCGGCKRSVFSTQPQRPESCQAERGPGSPKALLVNWVHLQPFVFEPHSTWTTERCSLPSASFESSSSFSWTKLTRAHTRAHLCILTYTRCSLEGEAQLLVPWGLPQWLAHSLHLVNVISN